MREESRNADGNPVLRFSNWFIVLIPVVLIACIAILVSVDRRFDYFEDSLQYRLPSDSDYVPTGDELGSLSLHPVQGQVVYVPAYSHIYHQEGRSLLLTITLSIRNTSMDHGIVVRSVRYFDTKGKAVKSHLETPLHVPPLGTTEFLIERSDTVGGSGANSLVEWVADQPVTEPIIEAIMIGTGGQQGISFARVGAVVRELGPASAPGAEAPPKDE